jgi:iron complex outermembrane receptor protein
MMSNRWILLCGAAAAAIVATPPATAQSPNPAPSVEDEEVIVTARRRDERLQETPVAVTAITAADLDNQLVADVKDLHLGIPNVTIVNNTGTTTGLQVYIRGVGQDDSSFTSESAIAVYVDGVYIGRQIGGLTDLFDVQSVEVLRGPQGTLYGRNSSGGAIKYTSRRPELDNQGGGLRLTGGSYDRLDLSGFVNVPLIQNRLALRVSANSRQEEGFINTINAAGANVGNDQNATDQQSGRLGLLWTPNDDWSVYASFDAFQDNSGPVAISSTNCTGFVAATQQCPLRFGDPFKAVQSVPDINRHRQQGAQATVTYDGFDFATLQSISSYRTFKDNLALDLSGNPAAPFTLIQFLNQDQYQQELTLSSKGEGPLSWTVGGFWFNEEIAQDATFGGARNVDSQESTSLAVFADARFELGAGVSVFGGVRYSDDEKSLNRRFANPAALPIAPLGVGSFEDSQTTPRIGLDWKLSEDVFLYASYSRGYKAGGFALARPTSPVGALGTFDSETVDSAEVGVRSQWFDRRVTVNATYFQTKNENLSQSVLTATSFSVVSGDADISGLELETSWRPIDGLRVYFNGGTLDTSWSRRPPAAPPGSVLKHAPDWHYKLGLDYTAPFGSAYEFFAAGNLVGVDQIYRNVANTVNIRSDAYSTVDAQVGIGGQDGAWRLSLSGRNLADEEYWEQGVSVFGRYYAKPRTWAMTLDTKF